jgi:hypothetical protein
MLRLDAFRRTTVLAILATVLVVASGCFDDDDSTGPDTADAPALPPADALDFDYSFFEESSPSMARAARTHYPAAKLYVGISALVTRIVLTPPVAAFAVALHTIPSPQEDGSWIWVYTHVNGNVEWQVRLRGKRLSDDRAEWSMRVSNTQLGWDQELWFDGETANQGTEGDWTFYDFQREGKPDVATISWGSDAEGDYLNWTDTEGDNIDDSLELRILEGLHTLTFDDASDPDGGWEVTWLATDGTGSIRAPNYNGGEKGCWDENQNDTECPEPAL